MRIENFSAYIKVDGVRLPEYCAEWDDDGKTSTVRCIVPSEEGKEFEICWEDSLRIGSTAGYARVDGQYISGKLNEPGGNWNGCVSEKPLSLTSAAPIKFGKLELTDDEDRAEQDERTVKEIGTIELKIYSGQRGYPAMYDEEPLTKKVVHERMKKAGGHCAVLGDEVHSNAAPPTYYAFVPDGSKAVRFVFSYKPKAYLQAQGILPTGRRAARASVEPKWKLEPATNRPRQMASSSGSSRKRGRDGDKGGDETGARALQLIQERLQERRSADQANENPNQVKLEHQQPPRPFQPGETIDLTGDSDDDDGRPAKKAKKEPIDLTIDETDAVRRKVKKVKKEPKVAVPPSNPSDVIDLT